MSDYELTPLPHAAFDNVTTYTFTMQRLMEMLAACGAVSDSDPTIRGIAEDAGCDARFVIDNACRAMQLAAVQIAPDVAKLWSW